MLPHLTLTCRNLAQMDPDGHLAQETRDWHTQAQHSNQNRRRILVVLA